MGASIGDTACRSRQTLSLRSGFNAALRVIYNERGGFSHLARSRNALVLRLTSWSGRHGHICLGLTTDHGELGYECPIAPALDFYFLGQRG
jgi:hypothetical protein